MNYPLVIFDWDGTLIDSGESIVWCLNQAAKKYGLPDRTYNQVAAVVGLDLWQATQKAFLDQDPKMIDDLVVEYRNAFFAMKHDRSMLFEGVMQGLKALQQKGHVITIATGKSRKGLDAVLAELEMADLFVVTKTADETQSKPDPQMLHEILAETGFSANQAIMVGDATFDLDMANAANIDTVAVTYGIQPIEVLRACKPTYEIDSFEQLLTVV
jgi:phosphoglycolate phosphatase